MLSAEIITYINSNRCIQIKLGTRLIIGFVTFSLIIVAIAFVSGGKYYNKPISYNYISIYEDALKQQSQEIIDAKNNAEESLTILARRLGHLQNQVIRLNALGGKLSQTYNLDEFNFSNEMIAVGGMKPEFQLSYTVPEFITELEKLSIKVESNDENLHALQSVLLNQSLAENRHPDIMPVKAYVSSWFGWRDDPMKKHNRKSFHEGMDFSADIGTSIKSVAAGIVSWSGPKDNYGNLIEIDHGNGYITRYAHIKEMFVKVGQKVNKGQQIASVGQTGRSTGPHLHFEIEKDGVYRDPKKYMKLN